MTTSRSIERLVAALAALYAFVMATLVSCTSFHEIHDGSFLLNSWSCAAIFSAWRLYAEVCNCLYMEVSTVGRTVGA